jgi:hypothetical protein
VIANEELKALVSGITNFAGWTHADRIRLFAWVQHSIRRKERFQTADINSSYDVLHYQKPNVSQYLSDMERRKELLRDSRGFYLEGRFRADYDSKYGEHEITLNVRQLVRDLPDKVPDLAEKDFMKEALTCLRHGAARAAIIMVWNIAFYHLCNYVLKHKLAEFNAGFKSRYPKKWQDAKVQRIGNYDDFSIDLKESEVIEICKSANIINPNLYKILTEKLGKRNAAAHPSTVRVTQVQAEAFIDELIRNGVLGLPI